MAAGKKTKLKGLEVTKVDFVDAGANQDAHIKLFKRKDGTEGSIPVEKNDNPVMLILKAIGKKLGVSEEIDTALTVVEKGNSQTFSEKMTEVSRQKIGDEIWNICYALQNSFTSILYDEDIDSSKAAEMMQQSLKEFNEIVSVAISDWSNGKNSVIKKSVEAPDLQSLEKFRQRLDGFIQKAKQEDIEEMAKIDKSKLNPEERAAFETMIAKCVVEEVQDPIEKSKVDPEKNEEEIEEIEPKKKTEKSAAIDEDVYKGIHPAVKAEIESLKKYRENAENRELTAIAKKYEVIGKKPDELVTTLKSLKEAGGTAYTDMISILDSAVALAENSGVFSEIGKSGTNRSFGIAKSAAESKVESIAKAYIEKDPALTYTDAIAKAWQNNPDLMAAYEEEAGF